MKVLRTVGEAVAPPASESESPVDEVPKVRGNEVVCRVSFGRAGTVGGRSAGAFEDTLHVMLGCEMVDCGCDDWGKMEVIVENRSAWAGGWEAEIKMGIDRWHSRKSRKGKARSAVTATAQTPARKRRDITEKEAIRKD